MVYRINLRAHLPKWITALFPSAIWRIPSGMQEAYLTFDDGPVPEVTPMVLDILKKYNIKATFFCVGENVARYPELFKQIKDEGHSIGNHTYNHIQGLKSNHSTYIENVEMANDLLKSKLFRPPHGTLKKSQYNYIIQHYKLIMWDVISCDYDPHLSPDQCLANVLNFVRDGSIITFHDSVKAKKNVLGALPKAIEAMLEKGYKFRKIEFHDKQTVPFQQKDTLWQKQKRSINRLQKKGA
ncbi:MAG: polysaccharide deacetylase family protein [Prolixibacteraceae bacterium]